MRITISQRPPDLEVQVEVEIVHIDGVSSEPPSGVEAFAASIAERLMAPFDKLKETWPDYDAWSMSYLADHIDSADEEVRERLLKDPATSLLTDVAGVSPSSASLVIEVAAHWPLPAGKLIETATRSLRVASLAIGLIAGPGLPVSTVLDLVSAGAKQKLTDGIAETLRPHNDQRHLWSEYVIDIEEGQGDRSSRREPNTVGANNDRSKVALVSTPDRQLPDVQRETPRNEESDRDGSWRGRRGP